MKAARDRDFQDLWQQFKSHVQEFVDRYGVGLELLGPEPLQMLIDEVVFDGKPQDGKPQRNADFGYFRDDNSGFELLGTATNLSEGRLDILSRENGARLTEGLLASSAFPAVFRPRWSWEIFTTPQPPSQYVDGGVMDNLPLDALVKFLADSDRFARRPDVPHLILTASLEPEPENWNEFEAADVEARSRSWMTLRRRAAELRYNKKIDKFQQAQSYIRRILETRELQKDPAFNKQDPSLPLNLEVLVVKPKWLCGTFAFHPMLGFRRRKQAESIAHGCASTMKAVYAHFFPQTCTHETEDSTKRLDTLRAWAKQRRIAYDTLLDRRTDLSREEQERGVCWFRRKGADGIKPPLCPFHRDQVLATSDFGSEELSKIQRDSLARELHQIYLACGRDETHQRK